jgi:hypothetical protein
MACAKTKFILRRSPPAIRRTLRKHHRQRLPLIDDEFFASAAHEFWIGAGPSLIEFSHLSANSFIADGPNSRSLICLSCIKLGLKY